MKQFISDFREREMFLKNVCRETGVSWIHLRILMELYSSESCRLQFRQLRDSLTIDSSNIRKAVIELEKMNMVSISKEGKYCVAQLTESGKLNVASINDYSFLRKSFFHSNIGSITSEKNKTKQ